LLPCSPLLCPGSERGYTGRTQWSLSPKSATLARSRATEQAAREVFGRASLLDFCLSSRLSSLLASFFFPLLSCPDQTDFTTVTAATDNDDDDDDDDDNDGDDGCELVSRSCHYAARWPENPSGVSDTDFQRAENRNCISPGSEFLTIRLVGKLIVQRLTSSFYRLLALVLQRALGNSVKSVFTDVAAPLESFFRIAKQSIIIASDSSVFCAIVIIKRP